MSKQARLFAAEPGSASPLAHRMRPRELGHFLGQEHLLGPGKPLREAIERGRIASLVLWGPPGSGKTTLAQLIAERTDNAFEVFSAVTEGVPRVREILNGARERLENEGRGTILFCDEIHRFNKAQQDAFLPAVEQGLVTLIGATTENPSFELNSALLSRVQVYVLEPLGAEHVRAIVARALPELAAEHGAPGAVPLGDDAIDVLVEHAAGDARRALNMCEIACTHAFEHASRSDAPLSADELAGVLQRKLARYDKSGEQHYNLISALHKAIRGSDVEGALYWLARMIDGGEDPSYLLRRLVRMASEDIGLGDPRALSIALAAKESYLFLGSPEGELAIAEAVVYLATAPKSNRVYTAWQHAQQAAAEHPAEEVPLHLRNAPTGLMKRLGYGSEYRYDHAEGGFAAGQTYLPERLEGAVWYEPADAGFEKTLRERLESRARRRRAGADE